MVEKEKYILNITKSYITLRHINQMTPQEFKQYRISKGLTQAQLAELLGYDTFHAILRKEKGESKVSKQDLIIIELKSKLEAVTAAYNNLMTKGK